ncbi:hypothetical protein AAC387_Pa10g0919 [Persea americana]
MEMKIGGCWAVLREFEDGEERMIEGGSDERMERRERDCCAWERMRGMRWVWGGCSVQGKRIERDGNVVTRL